MFDMQAIVDLLSDALQEAMLSVMQQNISRGSARAHPSCVVRWDLTQWVRLYMSLYVANIFPIYFQQTLGVWVETQKPAWTGLRRTNGGNRVFIKKLNLIGKNKYFRQFVTKT